MTTAEKQRDPLASLRIPRADPPRRGAGRRWLKRIVIVVLFIGLTVAGFVAAERKELFSFAEALQPRLGVRTSTVSVVTGRAGDAVVVATGYVESRQQARIGARATGRIESLDVEEGARVRKGQVLAVLEHADLLAALAAAEATEQRSRAEVAEQEVEIARTRREYDRVENLRASGASTESQLDDAQFAHDAANARLESLKAAVTLAEARVREAEQVIENMFVRAPFDGTVISKDAELGESILPGGLGEGSGRGSVVTIADLDHLDVDCDVKEDYISRVEIGQPAEVSVDAVPDRRYAGRVRQIIPMGDRARATIKVKVEILDADAQLFPEMSSTVYFLPDESEAAEAATQSRVYCPSDAIESDADGSYVWIVDNEHRAQRVDVRTGAVNEGRTEILAGLSGGERVIVKPPEGLSNNQLVDDER